LGFFACGLPWEDVGYEHGKPAQEAELGFRYGRDFRMRWRQGRSAAG
jgi:hypothetical protein